MKIDNDEIIGYSFEGKHICLECLDLDSEPILLEEGYGVLTSDCVKDGETIICDEEGCGRVIRHKNNSEQ